ncbi:DUF3043 domain-containing protein [Janibacter anophelis]|uniref:DUF3043 domain-containing protein n=1 Tax=Janibacter anophelis TaxID=319054 RepID=UPI000DEEF038|nr:DUF3043 domain-containing protein [Janibacter anophelis]
MFGRKKDDETAAPEVEERAHREGAKNRPTPKRRDQEAARKRPLVQADRKSARAADRAARRENAQKMREAMMTGDEKHLPPRDKGPVRRFVRDSVDVRFNLGEWLLPLMLGVLVLSLFAAPWATYAFLGVYLLIFVAILDAVLLWRRTKKKILERFGADTETRGLAMYTVMRCFQIRRTRMPKPMVERGGTPR